MNTKILALGAALGFALALAPSCGGAKKCDASTCPLGCCDSTGTCQLGNSNAACGSSGLACAPCLAGQVCQLGTCRFVSNTGGGSGGGSGGGTGGGSGGGTGGGSVGGGTGGGGSVGGGTGGGGTGGGGTGGGGTGGGGTGGGSGGGTGGGTGGGGTGGGGPGYTCASTMTMTYTETQTPSAYYDGTNAVGEASLVRTESSSGATDGGPIVSLLINQLWFNYGASAPANYQFDGGERWNVCGFCSAMMLNCDGIPVDPGTCTNGAFLAETGSFNVSQFTQDPDAGVFIGNLSGVQYVEWDFMNDAPVGNARCINLTNKSINASW